MKEVFDMDLKRGSIQNSMLVTEAVKVLKQAVIDGGKVYLYNKETEEEFIVPENLGFVYIQ